MTIPAGSSVVSVTVKGFDGLGADSCAKGSGACFLLSVAYFYSRQSPKFQNRLIFLGIADFWEFRYYVGNDRE